ncbi:hypothetical protein B0T14DRAFT_568545 [Immersiella caudata]|uniref:Uncharacterized protein n=1 Tax=Immersiella caudata TaxID=314043 RepID=A0AA40BX73_9PEZI|nr:hypothetical protein B0T14DRAFT_568545 [Immersiella caudata]
MYNTVDDTGLSAVYEPKGGAAVVDIVIVYGSQGRPYKTWACSKTNKAIRPTFAGSDGSERRHYSRMSLRQVLPRARTKPPDCHLSLKNLETSGANSFVALPMACLEPGTKSAEVQVTAEDSSASNPSSSSVL